MRLIALQEKIFLETLQYDVLISVLPGFLMISAVGTEVCLMCLKYLMRPRTQRMRRKNVRRVLGATLTPAVNSIEIICCVV